MRYIIFAIFTYSLLFSQPLHRPEKDDIEMIRKWKLIEYLELEEDQAEKFFPRLRSFEKDLKSIQAQKKEYFEKLENMLEDESIKSSEINDIIDSLYELDEDIISLKQNHFKNCDDILSSKQKVKYLTFERKFKKQMKNKLKNLKGRQGRLNRRF